MPASKLKSAAATLEALSYLTTAWLLLDVLPGRLYRRMLPPAVAPSSKDFYRDGIPLAVAAKEVLLRVPAAIRRVSARAPFRCVCFHRAIAAYCMLRRRGLPAQVHYGVARDEQGRTKAHVWVTCAGATVMGGGADREGYTEIASFVRPDIRLS